MNPELIRALQAVLPYLEKLTPDEIAQVVSAVQTLVAVYNKVRS